MLLLRGQRDERKANKAAEKAEAKAEKRRAEFERSPTGLARAAFERGYQVFQLSYDVTSQKPVIVAMDGNTVEAESADSNVILNSVCDEGWDLVTGSLLFLEQGQQRVGYYLFRRCPDNKRWAAHEG